MSIGFGHLAATLKAMHPDIGEESIEARIRYFHRHGFPSEKQGVGKGWRADYDATEVMKLACAFELLAAFVPPSQSISAVSASWESIEERLRGAWIERSERRFALPIILTGAAVGGKGEFEVALAPIEADDLRRWLQGRGDVRRIVVFDAVRVSRALEDGLTGEPPVDAASERGSRVPPDRQGRGSRMISLLDSWAQGKTASG